ncbi:hypothetical protein MHBO_005220, partial [Bonamia ostreae]
CSTQDDDSHVTSESSNIYSSHTSEAVTFMVHIRMAEVTFIRVFNMLVHKLENQ